MPPFIHDDFLLQSQTAKRLYHEVAKDLPIIDYHSHLPPQDVANDRRFGNLAELWLEEDHYKWRALRCNGVEEHLVTGDGDGYDKFIAWCRTIPATLRNPLYHWSHLEMARAFGITELINEQSAPSIWERANEQLQQEDFSANGFLKKFKVKVACTTDDPVDTLDHHRAAAADPSVSTGLFPTYRPDNALKIGQPEIFNPWREKLEAVSNIDCSSYDKFKEALKQRHDFFHSVGCRLSDHGMHQPFADFISEERAAAIYQSVLDGKPISTEEADQFASNLMVYFGALDAEKGWTKQLHTGVIRNVNTRQFQQLGPDSGFDTMADYPQGMALKNYLDRMDQDNACPKMVVYNLNPTDNYLIASMLACFQDAEIPGKMQYGSGWWFLDQKEGMEWQLNTLSNLGLLSKFVGMLTDSRSFLSFARHEYFRRILCNLIGKDVEQGLIPDEWELYSGLVRDVCYDNAASFFGFPFAE
ncbi:MAG: glucuronate isomerase [Verrucomicrobiota bacterium]